MVKYLFLTSEQAQEAINYAVNSYVLPDQTLIVNGVRVTTLEKSPNKISIFNNSIKRFIVNLKNDHFKMADYQILNISISK